MARKNLQECGPASLSGKFHGTCHRLKRGCRGHREEGEKKKTFFLHPQRFFKGIPNWVRKESRKNGVEPYFEIVQGRKVLKGVDRNGRGGGEGGGRIGEGASLTADTLRAHPPTVFQPSLRLMFLFT